MVRSWLMAGLLMLAVPLSALAAEDPMALASAQKRQHRFLAAEQTLAALLAREPDHLGATLQMGYLKHVGGDDQTAFTFIRRAATDHPESFEAQAMLVHAYLWIDRFEDAERHAEKTIATWEGRNPDKALWAKLLVGLGAAQGLRIRRDGLWAAIKYGTAVRGTFEKALAADPEGVMPLYALGRYYLEAPAVVGGDAAKGLELLRRAVRRDPDSYELRADFVRHLIRAGKRAEAKAELEAYHQQFADVPQAIATIQPIQSKLP